MWHCKERKSLKPICHKLPDNESVFLYRRCTVSAVHVRRAPIRAVKQYRYLSPSSRDRAAVRSTRRRRRIFQNGRVVCRTKTKIINNNKYEPCAYHYCRVRVVYVRSYTVDLRLRTESGLKQTFLYRRARRGRHKPQHDYIVSFLRFVCQTIILCCHVNGLQVYPTRYRFYRVCPAVYPPRSHTRRLV